jgi:predicted kinase
MAKIIALYGKICSGKSTYAETIRGEHNAIVLNTDKLILSIFGEDLGDKHDAIFRNARTYMFALAADIAAAGTNVILDLGFWVYRVRQYARTYFNDRNIEIEFRYINTPPDVIRRNVEKRNGVKDGTNFYIDEATLRKCLDSFEEPHESETDIINVRHKQER